MTTNETINHLKIDLALAFIMRELFRHHVWTMHSPWLISCDRSSDPLTRFFFLAPAVNGQRVLFASGAFKFGESADGVAFNYLRTLTTDVAHARGHGELRGEWLRMARRICRLHSAWTRREAFAAHQAIANIIDRLSENN